MQLNCHTTCDLCSSICSVMLTCVTTSWKKKMFIYKETIMNTDLSLSLKLLTVPSLVF